MNSIFKEFFFVDEEAVYEFFKDHGHPKKNTLGYSPGGITYDPKRNKKILELRKEKFHRRAH